MSWKKMLLVNSLRAIFCERCRNGLKTLVSQVKHCQSSRPTPEPVIYQRQDSNPGQSDFQTRVLPLQWLPPNSMIKHQCKRVSDTNWCTRNIDQINLWIQLHMELITNLTQDATGIQLHLTWQGLNGCRCEWNIQCLKIHNVFYNQWHATWPSA